MMKHHTELKDAGDNVVVTAEDLQPNGNTGWSWINASAGDKPGMAAEKGSLQGRLLAYASLGIKGGSAICKFVQHTW